MSRLHFLVFLLQLCTSILGAPLSTDSSLGQANGETLTLAHPTNLSLHDQSNLGYLLSDPLFRHIPNSLFTIIFRNYTVDLSRSDADNCVMAAFGDVLAHEDQMESKVDATREYAWGTVILSVFPEKTMRWVELCYAIKAVEEWLIIYDSVDLDFDVTVHKVGVVGRGRLANVVWNLEGRT